MLRVMCSASVFRWMVSIRLILGRMVKLEVRLVRLKVKSKVPISADKISEENLSEQYRQVLQYVNENGKITSHQAELLLQVKQRRARAILRKMADEGLLEKQGTYKTTVYVIGEGGRKHTCKQL